LFYDNCRLKALTDGRGAKSPPGSASLMAADRISKLIIATTIIRYPYQNHLNQTSMELWFQNVNLQGCSLDVSDCFRVSTVNTFPETNNSP